MEQESSGRFLEGAMKIVLILVLASSIVTTSCGVFADNETYVMPNGFTGMVLILFNQKDGKPPKYENGRRVYEIPADGILRTQFKINEGWQDGGVYFYLDKDTRIGIPYIDRKELSSEKVQVCCVSHGKAAKTLSDPWVEFSEFFVGTKSQIHEAGAKREKLNPADFVN